MPDVQNISSLLIDYGTLGLFCVFLIFCIVALIKYIQKMDERAEVRTQEFLKRTDEFIEVTRQYSVHENAQTELIKEVKQLVISIRSNQKSNG